MYYLSKFCRICVQTGVKLMDIDTVDFDSVRLSEKLETCTKLVLPSDISKEICIHCVTKLRISYQFQNMCKKSTDILQRYLTKLTSNSSETKDFGNCDLIVEIEPLSDVTLIESVSRDYSQIDKKSEQLYESRRDVCRRKQRITKERRCSLLKQLLTPTKNKTSKQSELISRSDYIGGLKDIIEFTKNYEFGFNLDKNSNIEATPLEKLKKFSSEFFRKDFTEFKNTVLYIIENKDNFSEASDDDSDAEPNCETTSNEDCRKQNPNVKFEEVMVEPDINIKNELMDDDGDSEGSPYDYLETSFGIECKTELKEEPPDLDDSLPDQTHQCQQDTSVYNNYVKTFLPGQHTPSMQLLDRLVSNYPPDSRKIFSPNNVRCRTRNNPYINPALKEQFFHKSFQCDKCSRYFKSPGYLKAHASKVHHR